jgi:predicted permease
MTDVIPIFSRVMGVFLVMGVGAFARRKDWLTRDADASLARLTAHVLLPAFFVDRILTGQPFESIAVAWVPPVIGFVTTVFGLLLAFVLAQRIGPRFGLASDGSQRAFALSAGICNYGYIPLPLAQYFYPEAEVSLILHNIGVDLALWTVGIWIIAGGKESSARRAILSPPMIAVVASITIKQLGWQAWIPAPVLQMTGALGDCTIPLGLVLSGAIIVDFINQVRWRSSAGTVIAACGYRLAIMPVIMLGIASLLPLSLDVRQVIVLQAAMPAAVFPIVLARLYDKDTTTALRVILSTGLAGIVTIPLWLYAGRLWLF